MDLVIGCVGKPSAGKSTFLNAATDANAKMGNYPFTTIEPNRGVTYFPVECACKRFQKTELCAPRYGKCVNGQRWFPVKVMDVAGLVPGAAEGKGLGNKFLDDLRHASVLIHVVDVSGTTDEKGQETKGYDPIDDVEWLRGEIHAWIFGNLWEKWGNITRRHAATKSTAQNTFADKLSGYGTKSVVVAKTLDRMGVKEPCDLGSWEKDDLSRFVDLFLDERFPTLLLLNKADHPDADQNIARICERYGEDRIVLSSAITELFIRKLVKQGFLEYEPGADNFLTKEDKPDSSLKPIDEKMKKRLENMRDMVLFRHGSTGVVEAVRRAVSLRDYVVAYPVKNIKNFTNNRGPEVFQDAVMLPKGSTVMDLARTVSPLLERFFDFAEGADGRRMGAEEELTSANNVVKISMDVDEATLAREKAAQREKDKARQAKKAEASKKKTADDDN